MVSDVMRTHVALSSEGQDQTGACLEPEKKLTTMPFEEWLKELGPLNQEERRRPPNGGWVVKRKDDLLCILWPPRGTAGFLGRLVGFS